MYGEEKKKLAGVLVAPLVAKIVDKYGIKAAEADPEKRSYIRLGLGVATGGIGLLKSETRLTQMPEALRYFLVAFGAENFAEAIMGSEGLVLKEELEVPSADVEKLRKMIDALRAENAKLKAELSKAPKKSPVSVQRVEVTPKAAVQKSAAELEKEMGFI